jgi:hypothetical protein
VSVRLEKADFLIVAHLHAVADCGQLDPGAVIRADPGEWRPRMRAGRDAIYQLAAMTIGARLAVAD